MAAEQYVSRVCRLGIIGMGGFAGVHHTAAREMEAAGWARLVCTCDPAPDAFPALLADLRGRGVTVGRDYREMLREHAGQLDVVAIPTPVPLHAPMHQAAVEAGLAVYLEKPPTLDHRELERMIATDRAARVPTLVGFNFIGEPTHRRLKARLLAGEFGPLREVRLLGLWPRLAGYYARSTWAARLLMDGRVVLDSCIGNALAHYVQNLLHWAGPDADATAPVASLRAQLYRAHAIESFDTVLLAAELGGPGRVALRVAASHACQGRAEHLETLVCEHATLRFHTQTGYTLEWRDGRTEKAALDPQPYSLVRRNYANLFAVLEGREPRPFTTLADCRPFVALNDLAFLSSGGVTTVAPPHAEPFVEKQDRGVAIAGLRTVADRFLETGAFPAAPALPWAGPPAVPVTPAALPRFTETWLAGLLPSRPPA